MVTTIQVPDQYGYTVAAVVSTFFVGHWLAGRVGSYRKAAKIPYPYEYASYEQIKSASPRDSKAMYDFNCAQRAHQNFNENHLIAVGSMLVAGLRTPALIGAMGAVWSVGRVLYGLGYTSGKEDGKGRYWGAAGLLSHYAMVLMAGYTAYTLAI